MIAICLLGISCGKLGGKGSGSDDKEGDSSSPASDSKKSLALDSKADLPACEEGNDKQLVYVIDEEQFYTCESSEWTEIDVTTEALGSNEFKDPVTGYLWFIGGKVTKGFITSACDGDYSAPSEAELTAAAEHGLVHEDGIWLSQTKYMDGGLSKTESTSGAVHATACVKK
jgi:hypothetical protein